jgi:enamine deaminase RidA (YjgF/YER057c/UK114 family)
MFFDTSTGGSMGFTPSPESSRQQKPEKSDKGSVLCYRMSPAKRMLCGSCDSAEHVAEHENGNQMPPCLLSDQTHAVVDLERVTRVGLMVTPQPVGDATDQAWEAISTIRAILKQQACPMTVTSQAVFVRGPEAASAYQKLFQAYFGDQLPATTFIVQPPCGGQELAVEAWALGGKGVQIEFPQPGIVCVAYDGLRWIHIGGISPPPSADTAYSQSAVAFDELAQRLAVAGASMTDVVRVWLYQGGITEPEQGIERYRELNRARTDFFNREQAEGRMQVQRGDLAYYPASTGIGTAGLGLELSCLALQTQRSDVRLLPLENSLQTPAFNYAARFSARSPKFSRAMAVVIGDYVTTWVSGTASILNSETVHLGDAEKQTEQTIDNIQALIGPENFARHGMPGAGAQLRDLAKVRVYVKRPEDYETCRAVCERRFGALPIVYAQADVCRSNLLVEIEGVAFSALHPTPVHTPIQS